MMQIMLLKEDESIG